MSTCLWVCACSNSFSCVVVAYTEEGLAYHVHATPLHFAIIRKEAEIVYSLLLHGADTSIDHTTTVDRRPTDSTTLSTQQLLEMVIAGQPLRTAKIRDATERMPMQQADYLRALVRPRLVFVTSVRCCKICASRLRL